MLCAGFWAPKDPFSQLRFSPVKLNILPGELLISASLGWVGEECKRGSTEICLGLLLPLHGAGQSAGELSALFTVKHLPASNALGTLTDNLHVSQNNRRAGRQLPPLPL